MISERAIKTVLGGFKTEWRKIGAAGGDKVAVRYGDALNDPRWNETTERVAGLLTEWLEGGWSGHPILGPGTSVASDIIEQAMSRIWGKDRTRTGVKRGSDRSSTKVTKDSSVDDVLAKTFAQALKELFEIPYGIPEDERLIREDEVKARLHRELDRINAEKDLRSMFEERVKELRGEVEEEFPPYHIKMSKPKLVEIAHLAGIENVPKGWSRKRIVEEIDMVRGIQSPINEIVKQTKLAATRLDEGAGKLASRLEGWLDKNTDEQGRLLGRTAEKKTKREARREAKAEREADKLEQKRQQREAKAERRTKQRVKREVQRVAKSERKTEKLAQKSKGKAQRKHKWSVLRSRKEKKS